MGGAKCGVDPGGSICGIKLERAGGDGAWTDGQNWYIDDSLTVELTETTIMARWRLKIKGDGIHRNIVF